MSKISEVCDSAVSKMSEGICFLAEGISEYISETLDKVIEALKTINATTSGCVWEQNGEVSPKFYMWMKLNYWTAPFISEGRLDVSEYFAWLVKMNQRWDEEHGEVDYDGFAFEHWIADQYGFDIEAIYERIEKHQERRGE